MLSQDQLNACMQQHESVLLAYAADFVGQHRACDVVQEAFLELYHQQQRVINKRAWLFKVCRNKSIDILRKEDRMHVLEHDQMIAAPGGDDPATRLSQAESAADLQAAVSQLPLQQQEVLRLRFQESMSYKAIAEITGLTVSNVGFILHTVLKALRQELQHKGVQS